uniref:Uncharacterized protein n=1 Tax=Timspurckia oligopyrenoides TaxID=708627 RepID=A0A7S0ZFZ6_9RHOD|mmetsp:Transcript_3799/g.6649  ORF Transcript_3799/g.6649 Transcript_3799/m.6649 type:complete len:695 (+) Transcript_3799:66-2150(+)
MQRSVIDGARGGGRLISGCARNQRVVQSSHLYCRSDCYGCFRIVSSCSVHSEAAVSTKTRKVNNSVKHLGKASRKNKNDFSALIHEAMKGVVNPKREEIGSVKELHVQPDVAAVAKDMNGSDKETDGKRKIADRHAIRAYLYRKVHSPLNIKPEGHIGLTKTDFLENFKQYTLLSSKIQPLQTVKPSGALHVDPPELAHGLEVVLQHKGVVPLVDLKSKQLQFSDFLKKIPSVAETNWAAIPPFRSPSNDTKLHEVVSEYNQKLDPKDRVKYIASTSSMTSALGLVYLVLSNFKDPMQNGFSEELGKIQGFSRYVSQPVGLIMRPRVGTLAIDSEKSPVSQETVLMSLGHSMERMLTMEPDIFNARLLLNTAKNSQKDGAQNYAYDENSADAEPQSYNYTRMGDFFLRAQLDAMDKKTGLIFDLKTRATLKIRYNIENYKQGVSYLINQLKGENHSFEREFYDLIRTAFIKYAYQIKIGRMNGAFVAFHNTDEIFGFEYVPIEEIDTYVFGGEYWGSIAFDRAVQLYNIFMNHAMSLFPNRKPEDSVRIVICPLKASGSLHFFVQLIPANEEDPCSGENLVKILEKLSPRLRPLTSRILDTDLSRIVESIPRTQNADSLGINLTNLKGFSVNTISFVNGNRKSGAFNVEPKDKYDVAYKITPLSSKMPARVFLQVWSQMYDIAEMARPGRTRNK